MSTCAGARSVRAAHGRAGIRRAGGRRAGGGAKKPTSRAIVASGVMALPAFTDQGGPFAGRKGRIEGGAPRTRRPRGGAGDRLFRADGRPYAERCSRRRATSSSKAASTARPPSPPCSPPSCPAATCSSRPAAGAAEGAACSPAGASRTPRRSSRRRGRGLSRARAGIGSGGNGAVTRSAALPAPG